MSSVQADNILEDKFLISSDQWFAKVEIRSKVSSSAKVWDDCSCNCSRHKSNKLSKACIVSGRDC